MTGDAYDNGYNDAEQFHPVSVGAGLVAVAALFGLGHVRQRTQLCTLAAQPLIMKIRLPCATHGLLIPTVFALLLVMNTYAAGEKTLFDFQAATNTADWQVVNDDVMGGVSASSFRLTNGVAWFQGKVSLENNGGFASVRSLPASHNLSGCDAFVIRVRGDGRRYKFTARTAPSFDSAIYQCAFTTKKGKWEEHRLPFNQFVATFRGRVLSGEPPLDPAKVTSVGFLISDSQDGPFQLEVAWLKVALPAGQ